MSDRKTERKTERKRLVPVEINKPKNRQKESREESSVPPATGYKIKNHT